MTEEDLKIIKSQFLDETGMDLFQAMNQYYGQYNGSGYCYDDDSAMKLNKDLLLNTIEELKTICLNDKDYKAKLEIKHINKFNNITIEKLLGGKQPRTSELYTAIKPFLNEDLIRENLIKNPTLCWNPFVLLNQNKFPGIKECICIFTPSESLFKKYNFIHKKYCGDSRVVNYFYINIEEFNQYRLCNIEVNSEDILNLRLTYMHPYHRGLIQNSPDFSLLTIL